MQNRTDNAPQNYAKNMIFDNKKSETRKKVVEVEQINSFTKEASELFRDKPFAEANKVQFISAKVIGVVAQIVSVFLSVNFASKIFSDLLPTFLQNYYFVTFLSLVVLGIIEYAKRFTIKSIAVSYFKKSLSLGNILLFLLLFGVSIYAAVTGAVEYTKEQTDKSDDIAAAAKDELHDVSNDYKRQIKEAQNDLKEFKKSVSWHGAINTSDQKTMDLIATKQARIAKLQDALEKDKDDIRKNKEVQIVENSAKVVTSSVRIFCFSLTVEMVSLLCIGFIYYFLGTTHIDNYIDGRNEPIVTITTHDDLKRPKNDTKPIVTTNRYDTQAVENLPKPSENRTVVKGFERNEDTPNRNDNEPKKTPCSNCKTHFTPKNARHKFCSDSCRLEAWQMKNGTTVFGTK